MVQGWNDVSFHGSDQVQTPNIDMLAYTGVSLGRYYSHAICTPSRSALLSGFYSHIVGMQGLPLAMSEDRGLPINITIMPQYFNCEGFRSHIIGKWHLGASRLEFLPTERGFLSHIGHRGGYMDYYEYTLQETFETGQVTGMTLYRNLTAAWDIKGYITDVYTKEAINIIANHDTRSPLFLLLAHNAPHGGDEAALLQAPVEVVRQMRYVESAQRRIFAAMVKKLDDSVGAVFKALKEKGILENTILVFISDNGGMTSGFKVNYGSNYPLRGIKMSPFEGGVRVPGLVWSMNLKNTDHYWGGYMHVSDWLPTLLSAAGLEVPSGINGINQWDNINSNSKSSRDVMYEIDDYTGHATIIYGNYKLVTGNVPHSYSTYQGGDLRGIIGEPPSYIDALLNSTVHSVLDSLNIKFNEGNLNVRSKMTLNCSVSSGSICFPGNGTVCLYNIIEDPCETTDLSESNPELVSTMKVLLEEEAAKRIPRVVPYVLDPRSAPSLHNYTWTPWIES